MASWGTGLELPLLAFLPTAPRGRRRLTHRLPDTGRKVLAAELQHHTLGWHLCSSQKLSPV